MMRKRTRYLENFILKSRLFLLFLQATNDERLQPPMHLDEERRVKRRTSYDEESGQEVYFSFNYNCL